MSENGQNQAPERPRYRPQPVAEADLPPLEFTVTVFDVLTGGSIELDVVARDTTYHERWGIENADPRSSFEPPDETGARELADRVRCARAVVTALGNVEAGTPGADAAGWIRDPHQVERFLDDPRNEAAAFLIWPTYKRRQFDPRSFRGPADDRLRGGGVSDESGVGGAGGSLVPGLRDGAAAAAATDGASVPDRLPGAEV